MNNIESVQRFIAKIVEDNYFPKLEGVSVSSIAEISRRTGLNPYFIYKLIKNQKMQVSGLEVTIERASLPKLRDKARSQIWNEGQRYQRRGPFEKKAKPTRNKYEALANNIEVKRSRVLLEAPIDESVAGLDRKKLNREMRWIQKAERISSLPEDKFFNTILDLARFPTQNLNILKSRITEVVKTKKPFRFGCFACLSITSDNINGRPQVRVVPEGEIRILEPKIRQRTTKIIESLDIAGVPFSFEFILADIDPKRIYKSNTNFELEIEETLDRINKLIPQGTTVIRWSEIETRNCINSGSIEIDEKDVEKSVQRRLIYYRQKGFTITPELIDYARDCSRRLIESYTEQGPILDEEYDAVAIADADPLKFAKYQSLLCPGLPIWFPYSG
jgi:hypothetical protein